MKKATLTHIVNEQDRTTLMADQQRKIVGTKGYGGIIKLGESALECACREMYEETDGIIVLPEDLEPVTLVLFYDNDNAEPSFEVLGYRCSRYTGTASDTFEMKNPVWYLFDPIEALPFEKMIVGDHLFVPNILNNVPIKGWIRMEVEIIDGNKHFIRVIDSSLQPCDRSELVI